MSLGIRHFMLKHTVRLLQPFRTFQYNKNQRMVMITYRLFKLGKYHFKLHHFLDSDLAECFHSHNYDSYRMVLCGMYEEEVLTLKRSPLAFKEALQETRNAIKDTGLNESEWVSGIKPYTKNEQFKLNVVHALTKNQGIMVFDPKSTMFLLKYFERHKKIIKPFRPTPVGKDYIHRVHAVVPNTWSLWINKEIDKEPVITIGEGWK
jgi:hypothetical protein